jgi:hypothetical protein
MKKTHKVIVIDGITYKIIGKNKCRCRLFGDTTKRALVIAVMRLEALREIPLRKKKKAMRRRVMVHRDGVPNRS